MMTYKTRSQLLAENITLNTRLVELEAKQPCEKNHPPEVDKIVPKELNDPLKASEVRYRRLFETANDGILILDADTGQITDVNPFLEEMLGYSFAELSGKTLWEIGPFKDVAASQNAFRLLQRQEYIRYDNLPQETKADEHKQVEFVSNVYWVEDKRVIQCNIRDITARKNAEADLKKANKELVVLVAELQRRDNDMQVLNRMNDLLRACRQGGDEFFLVLTNSSLEHTWQRVEQIRLLVKETQIRHDDKLPHTMTMSAGIVEAGENSMTVGDLLRAADKALYAAKQAGRDRIVIFETNHTDHAETLPQVTEANMLRLVDVVNL